MSLPFKWIFGYGHQPARALLWVAGLLAVTTWYSHETYIRGQFTPTSPVVLTSKEWLDSFPKRRPPRRFTALEGAVGGLGAHHTRARL